MGRPAARPVVGDKRARQRAGAGQALQPVRDDDSAPLNERRAAADGGHDRPGARATVVDERRVISQRRGRGGRPGDDGPPVSGDAEGAADIAPRLAASRLPCPTSGGAGCATRPRRTSRPINSLRPCLIFLTEVAAVDRPPARESSSASPAASGPARSRAHRAGHDGGMGGRVRQVHVHDVHARAVPGRDGAMDDAGGQRLRIDDRRVHRRIGADDGGDGRVQPARSRASTQKQGRSMLRPFRRTAISSASQRSGLPWRSG